MTNYTRGGCQAQGAGHAYLMQAGTGNTLIIGGRGNDTIYGGSGNDTLYGGGGAGNKCDVRRHRRHADVRRRARRQHAVAATGTHILYGGSGQDVLYGGDGVNIAVNNTGTGLVTPGGDGGDVGVNILAAGTGNTTLYSDAAGHRREHPARRQRPGRALRRRRHRRLPGGRQRRRLPLWRHGQRRLPVALHPGRPAGRHAGHPGRRLRPDHARCSSPSRPCCSNGQITQVSLNPYSSDNNMDLTAVAGTTNEFLATLQRPGLGDARRPGAVHHAHQRGADRADGRAGRQPDRDRPVGAARRAHVRRPGAQHPHRQRRQRRADRRLRAPASWRAARGNDSLYGGGIPAIYQSIINSLGAGTGGPVTTGGCDLERADDLAAAAAGRPQHPDRRLGQLGALRRQRRRPAHRRQRDLQLPDGPVRPPARARAATSSRAARASDLMIGGLGSRGRMP